MTTTSPLRAPDVFMWQAIELASRNRTRPFAAVIVDKTTELAVATGLNRVNEHPLWHAEIDAINHLTTGGNYDPRSLTLFSTAEPCPMCFSAILWSGIQSVVFGTDIERLVELGWRQIEVTSDELLSRSPEFNCYIAGGVLREECDQLSAAGPDTTA